MENREPHSPPPRRGADQRARGNILMEGFIENLRGFTTKLIVEGMALIYHVPRR